MKICPKCKNTEFTKQGLCSYCVWKGDEGPGLLLKVMIKQINESKGERDEPKVCLQSQNRENQGKGFSI